MVLLLSFFGLAALIFIAALLADGVRMLLRRRRLEDERRPLELVVAGQQEAADHLVCLTLTRPGGGRLPAFSAGQHVLLQVPAGPGGKRLQRAYSLAAWTKKPRCYELGIKREAQGAVSRWARENLRAGARVQVLPPRGDFVLREGPGELVLIGGGIGITAMRAMLHAALAENRRRPRVILFYAARTQMELLWHGEFQALAAAHRNFHYRPLLSRPEPGWMGESGRLSAALVLRAPAAPQRADFYLCAGSGLMDALHAGLLEANVGAGRVHREAFGVAPGAGESGHTITLSDGTQLVTAGEPTLLATLEAHLRAPASECRSGSCGQCRMRLLDGRVRWLLAPELKSDDGEILPCVCVPEGDIRLAACLNSDEVRQAQLA